MTSRTIHLGISTCPNDTFAFAALLEGRVDTGDIRFEIELLDIQQLNDRLSAGDFDAAKSSFFTALKLAGTTFVLPSGSALGFGVGPLLLAASPDQIPQHSKQTTLCPGADTTAHLLFALFYGGTTGVRQTVFSEILPALQAGRADFGVCIHEGRFTWRETGLALVDDLGQRWEALTNTPLPLGGIIARRSLSKATLDAIQTAIHDSLRLALQDPSSALPKMRRYAQEFDDAVLMQHVDLYVNQWTLDLGRVGSQALQELSRQAKRVGCITTNVPDLEIWSR